MVSFFPELVYLRDDPIADIAGFGYYSVMKLAREHNVPVVLQGQGGDELFWGYGWVRAAAQAQHESSARNQSVGRYAYVELNPRRACRAAQIGEWVHGLGGLRDSWENLRRDGSASPDQMVFYDLVPDFRASMREARTLFESLVRGTDQRQDRDEPVYVHSSVAQPRRDVHASDLRHVPA